jgi:chorismate-pyruvate lyase
MQRLPADMRMKLETTNIPIGLLWREAKLETHREIIEYRRERNAVVSDHLGVDKQSELLSRTYLLYTSRQPMGVITEKFPAGYFVE